MSLHGISFISLGLILGIRHAFDPDHLAAVSTIVTEGGGLKRAARVGLFWGLGHTATLLVAGMAWLRAAPISPGVFFYSETARLTFSPDAATRSAVFWACWQPISAWPPRRSQSKGRVTVRKMDIGLQMRGKGPLYKQDLGCGRIP